MLKLSAIVAVATLTISSAAFAGSKAEDRLGRVLSVLGKRGVENAQVVKSNKDETIIRGEQNGKKVRVRVRKEKTVENRIRLKRQTKRRRDAEDTTRAPKRQVVQQETPKVAAPAATTAVAQKPAETVQKPKPAAPKVAAKAETPKAPAAKTEAPKAAASKPEPKAPEAEKPAKADPKPEAAAKIERLVNEAQMPREEPAASKPAQKSEPAKAGNNGVKKDDGLRDLPESDKGAIYDTKEASVKVKQPKFSLGSLDRGKGPRSTPALAPAQ